MQAEITDNHRWLQQLVGNWTFEADCDMGPGQPRAKLGGVETVESIGGLWTIGRGTGEGPDGKPTLGIMTLGFDPSRERFTGSFIASMMSFHWIYDGELNVDRTVLTLSAAGPNMMNEGKLTTFHDIIEIVSPDHRILRSRMQMIDGSWYDFMEAHYRRT